MRMKLTTMAVLAALLACALAAGALGAQFTSKIGIRFVEVTDIREPPIPLADGTDAAAMDPTEPPEDGADETEPGEIETVTDPSKPEGGTDDARADARWARSNKPHRQCE